MPRPHLNVYIKSRSIKPLLRLCLLTGLTARVVIEFHDTMLAAPEDPRTREENTFLGCLFVCCFACLSPRLDAGETER